MTVRLAITLAALALAWGALALLKRRQLASAGRAAALRNAPARLPTIVSFWSSGCSVCKQSQRPILERLLGEYGPAHLALTAYDVEAAPEIAAAWGVRTLPTTFVLDALGAIRDVNNGLAAPGRLRKQLEPLMSKPEEP